MGKTEEKPQVQGEGDYEAARRYRKDVEEFVGKTDIDAAAREAAPKSPAEQDALENAERQARSRAKADEDPEQAERTFRKPGTPSE